jgi:hypothetical protein
MTRASLAGATAAVLGERAGQGAANKRIGMDVASYKKSRRSVVMEDARRRIAELGRQLRVDGIRFCQQGLESIGAGGD